jgi:transketolase
MVTSSAQIAGMGIGAVPELFDCRDAYSQTLEDMASEDKRVCAVVNDSVSSTKMNRFKDLYPDRFVNVGIAEQNMVGIGAGLANGGMVPYVCGASCFLTARAMEQVKVDLGYSKWNVKLCGMSSGMAYGQLGPTHHSIEDLAWTRVIPNLTVIVPADPQETEQVMRYSLEHHGPMFLRISRMPVAKVHAPEDMFTLGRAATLHDGDDVAIVTNGVLVSRAISAAKQLAERGISARVLNMSSIKPLDSDAIIKAARETRGIVTVEEALQTGGLGGAVAEVVALHHPCRVRMLGLPDVFAPTGSAEFLLDYFQLNADGITNAVCNLLEIER